MATMEHRIREPVRHTLDLDPNFEASLGDPGVSSADAMSSMKAVGREFSVEIFPAIRHRP